MMQLPNEDLFFQGRMTTAWLMFFQSLSNVGNDTTASNLDELIQLANQQVSIANQAATNERLDALETVQAMQPLIAQLAPPQHVMSLMQASLPPSDVLPSIVITDQYLQVINP